MVKLMIFAFFYSSLIVLNYEGLSIYSPSMKNHDSPTIYPRFILPAQLDPLQV